MDSERFESNRNLITWEISEGLVELGSYPYEVQFGPENRCNLRCIMCRESAVRKAGDVPLMDRRLEGNSLDLLNKLESCLPCWQRISVTGSGETLLSPVLAEILEVLQANGIAVSLVSNGLLIDRDRARLLVESGVEELSISVDAACSETYERIRAGARWGRLLRAIETLNAAKAELGSPTPRLQFSGNFMRCNIEELPGLVEFAAEHGADSVWATRTVLYDKALEDQDLHQHPRLTAEMVSEATRRAGELGVTLLDRITASGEAGGSEKAEQPESPSTPPVPSEPPLIIPPPGRRLVQRLRIFSGSVRRLLGRAFSGWSGRTDPAGISRSAPSSQSDSHLPPVPREEKIPILETCTHPWTGLVVWSDGSVRACCLNSLLLGNLHEQSFEEIWNGEPAKGLRRSFLNGQPPDGCRDCHMVSSLGNGADPLSRKATSFRCFLDVPQEGDTLSGTALLDGWAYDDQGISSVEILLNGVRASTAECGVERPDVLSSLSEPAADLRPGFRAALETGAFSDGWHLLSLRVFDGTGQWLEACHRSVRIGSTLAAGDETTAAGESPGDGLSTIDSPQVAEMLAGPVMIFGWALDSKGIESVEILVNGEVVGTAEYGLTRTDVAAAFPAREEALHSGYEFRLDTTAIPDGEHRLALRITSGAGDSNVANERIVIFRNSV